LPVQYVRTENVFIILPGAPEKKTWWRNLRGGAPVELLWQGQVVSGQADLISAANEPELACQALSAYFTKFPPTAGIHNVHPLAGGGFDPQELCRAAESTIIVRVK
jgi:hypothetical protein